MRITTLLLASLCLAASPATAGDAPKSEVAPKSVLELFTSQGCSSCPPADRLAKEISDKGASLVLTLPVDYWDYLGWKDTLASPANSARQRAYAMARTDRKVFTPQIIVNGRESSVGGDRRTVEASVSRAESAGLPLAVALSVREGRVEVAVKQADGASQPGAPQEQRAEVWAFAIERQRTVDIGRGENAGREVTYANVVRHMTRLGVWDGQPARFEIANDEVSTTETNGVAILVQTGNGGQPGQILGATLADAPPARPPAATAARMTRDPY